MSQAPGTLTLGLVSDTHGFFHPALADHFRGVARILHAGDVGDPAVIEALERIAPVTVVRGNIDGGPLRHLPLTATFELGGKRIASLHIAGSPKRPNRDARELLRAERPEVFVVGHSHIWTVARVEGALWLNPGAAGNHGFHEVRTAARLHIDPDGELRLERIVLGARGSTR